MELRDFKFEARDKLVYEGHPTDCIVDKPNMVLYVRKGMTPEQVSYTINQVNLMLRRSADFESVDSQ